MSRSPSSLFALFLTVTTAACETKPPPAAETTPTPAESAAAAAPTPEASSAASAAEPAAERLAPPPAQPAPDATPPKEAQRTKSGVASVVLTPGTGKKHPKKTDAAKVSLTGWTGGKQAFTTREPTVMPIEQMAPGWQEGIALMVEGEKRRLWIPGKLAYGNAPGGPAPTEDLILDLEFLGSVEPPAVPKDLTKPPADAKKTESGLVYRLLTKGTGSAHPAATSSVTVHYSGWSKDGKMFDSSVMRGSPTSFGLNQVIPGWTEGVQLMVVGDKMRFWIPAKMAYGETPKRPGTPAGDLVFDVELIAIR